MAAHIVDVLEAVEIDEQHSTAPPSFKHVGKGLTQPVVAYNVPLAATQPALHVIEGAPQSV